MCQNHSTLIRDFATAFGTNEGLGQDRSGNQLLAHLSHADWLRLLPYCEWVDMPLGQVLYLHGSKINHVYFPTTAITSLLYMTKSGASTETAVVGNEGVVGVARLLGCVSTSSNAEVICAGMGIRVKAQAIQDEFNRSRSLMHLMLRYTQALMTQVAQTAVCNRYHSLHQQLCRWLLMNLDRQHGSDLVMTHQLIANMIGFRREGVTAAALELKELGLISYKRGYISVLDRAGLEERACECYAVVKKEYARLLPLHMVAGGKCLLAH